MSVQDIYNKLRTAPEFHPASADLFDDFTIEAGDVISVASDSEHYALPVFAQHMVWNGSAMVTVQSQGDKERKPLPVLQRKLFASGRGAYVSDRESEEKFKRFDRFIESTDERFSYLMTESEWDDAAQEAHVTMQSQVTMTARELSTTVAKTGINNLGQGETLYDITPHHDVPAPDYSSLESRILKLEGFMHELSGDSSATGNSESATKSDSKPDVYAPRRP
ncbi:MAG: hypothetical protein IK140_02250 [Clostridia bacterium]|nr:hypothetical protein [Clostridia bacterium]